MLTDDELSELEQKHRKFLREKDYSLEKRGL